MFYHIFSGITSTSIYYIYVYIISYPDLPRSSAINLGEDSFSCPGRAVNIREKSSLLKCREQILECFDSLVSNGSLMDSSAKYKVDPFLPSPVAFLTIVSKKRNFMQANSNLGDCLLVTAVRHTAVRHN